MHTSGYTAEDLQTLSAILDAAIREACERELDLPISVMTRRLFDAARWGERDPDRLKGEVLGDALLSALAARNSTRWAPRFSTSSESSRI